MSVSESASVVESSIAESIDESLATHDEEDDNYSDDFGDYDNEDDFEDSESMLGSGDKNATAMAPEVQGSSIYSEHFIEEDSHYTMNDFEESELEGVYHSNSTLSIPLGPKSLAMARKEKENERKSKKNADDDHQQQGEEHQEAVLRNTGLLQIAEEKGNAFAVQQMLKKKIERMKARDVNLLAKKKERAKQRRMEHEQDLEKARKEAEYFEKETDKLRKLYGETKMELAKMAALVKGQGETIVHLEKANQQLEKQVVVMTHELLDSKRNLSDLERNHAKAIRDLKDHHEQAIETMETKLRHGKMEIEAERAEMESKCLEKARKHEARVDRLQLALEQELVMVDRDRKAAEQAKKDAQEKLQAMFDNQRVQLETEREQLRTEYESKMEILETKTNAVNERLIALEAMEQQKLAEKERLVFQREEIASTRTWVESERDRLSAAIREADHEKRKSQMEVANAEQRMKQALLELEQMEHAKILLANEQRELAKEKEQLRMKQAQQKQQMEKIEQMRDQLARAIAIQSVPPPFPPHSNQRTETLRQPQHDTPSTDDQLWSGHYFKTMLHFPNHLGS